MNAVTIYTPNANCFDSYGILALNLAREYTKRGIRVTVRTHGGPAWHESQPADIRRITSSPPIVSAGGIVLGYPTEYYDHSPDLMRGPRVAITTFESTVTPHGWDKVLNTCSAVLTPSTWSAQMLRENGVEAEIIVNPEGISPEYQYAPRASLDAEQALETDDRELFERVGLRDAPWLGRRPLNVLMFADRPPRRSVELGLGAFGAAFGYWDARLIIKAREGVKFPQFDNPNIYTLAKDLTERGMALLYSLCDVMIFPTRGEGFGRPPREFAATGGIALVPNWSGLTDHIEQWGTPINDYEMVPAWKGHPRHEGLGEWAEPDPLAFAAALREVAAMPIEERNEIGKQRSIAIRQLYRWDRYADRVWDALQTARQETINVQIPYARE